MGVLNVYVLPLFAIMRIEAVPPEACFANFRWDDCGKAPTPVMYYWKPGSRCEVGLWRGCVPNLNMFQDEYECVATCIFTSRAMPEDYHSLNENEIEYEMMATDMTTESDTDVTMAGDVTTGVTDVTAVGNASSGLIDVTTTGNVVTGGTNVTSGNTDVTIPSDGNSNSTGAKSVNTGITNVSNVTATDGGGNVTAGGNTTVTDAMNTGSAAKKTTPQTIDTLNNKS